MGIELLFIVFLIGLMINMPVAFVLATSVTVYLVVTEKFSLLLMVQQLFGGLNSYVFLAIPLFILSGIMMQRGGIAKRLVNLSSALLDKLTGGFAMSSALASMIFASISGSGPATTAAIGGVVLPELERKGYGKKWSVAFLASAGTMGPIIPPSIFMILFGVMAGTSIVALFIGGIIPGLLIGISLMIISYFRAKKLNIKSEYKDFNWKDLYLSFKESFFAVLMPVIIIVGILGGIFTPTEAAVVSVIYAYIVSAYIYRSLSIRDMMPILVETAKLSGVVLFITANAAAFAWLVNSAQVAQKLVSFSEVFIESQFMFLLCLNIFLLFIGMFLDTASALLIVVPILIPLTAVYGIDPLHLGLITIINLSIGMATPPLGLTLFSACAIGKVSISDTIRPIIPMIGALVLVLFLVTYLPKMFLWLPNLFF